MSIDAILLTRLHGDITVRAFFGFLQ